VVYPGDFSSMKEHSQSPNLHTIQPTQQLLASYGFYVHLVAILSPLVVLLM